MCPHCRQNAPIVYQGVAAYCSACGKPRVPLMAPSVSYAGKPSKVGGTAASVIGWIVLAFGMSTALGLGLLLGSLISTGVGLAFGLPIGLFTAVFATVLILSGKKLRKEGDTKQRETWRQAVFALATNRNGAVTANDAARALGIPPAEADAFLTELAKTIPEEVTVEIDDNGRIYYAFPRLLPMGKQRIAEPRVRVDGAPAGPAADELEYEEPAEQAQRRRGP
jgi:hypothetical protein